MKADVNGGKPTKTKSDVKQVRRKCYWDWLEEAEKASFMAWNRSRKN